MKNLPTHNKFINISAFQLKAWEICKPRMVRHVYKISPQRYNMVFTKATAWGFVEITFSTKTVIVSCSAYNERKLFSFSMTDLSHLELFLSKIHSIECVEYLKRNKLVTRGSIVLIGG